MKENIKEAFFDYFEDIEDHRIERCKLYPINEILFLTVCAVICGAEGWIDIEEYGQAKIEFLRQYFEYENGIPSDDILRRFFRVLDPEAFRQRFISWIGSLDLPEETVIAIDGKVSRHTFDKDKEALHLVSAFASEARLVLAQTKVSDKSNEITAIPDILDWIALKGVIITIDAMGCQREVAEKIIQKEGDYILALKGNQGTLHQDVKLLFQDKILLKEFDVDKSLEADKGHGRIEERICRMIQLPETLKKQHNWPGLQTVIEIEAYRDHGVRKDTEKRYYISSLQKNAKKANGAIRLHWGIENGLHWILDMSFADDQSRIRQGNAPENMAIVKHSCLNLLQAYKGKRDSIKQLRKKAGWHNGILSSILSKNLVMR